MTQVLEEVDLSVDALSDHPWVTIVWNDPVNLMTYVSYVFRSYFGHTREEAERLMLLVHNEGRAVVATGGREEMERPRRGDARLRPVGDPRERRRMIAFTRDDEVVTARFTTDERALLSSLAHQLIELLGERAAESPADLLYAQLGIGGQSTAPLDSALARLLPDAYRDDAEGRLGAPAVHRARAGGQEGRERSGRSSGCSRRTRCGSDDADVQAWLRHLTDLRLVIAARLQIEEDDDVGLGDDALLDLYDWLGYLQGTLVECIE